MFFQPLCNRRRGTSEAILQVAVRMAVRITDTGGRSRGSARARLVALAAVVCLAVLGTGCDESPSALDPKGPGAARIADLWWVMIAICVVILVGVMTLLGVALFRKRRPATDEAPRTAYGFMVVGGIVLPIVVLSVLMGLTVHSLRSFANAGDGAQLTVSITGHDWWWEVRYPDADAVSANEIHIPAGQPVRVEGDSADVIHSFWVPQLGGKVDLIPGKHQSFVVEADRPGVYRGQCAEFCGLQHAHMAFTIVAQTPAEFDAWLKAQAQPRVPLTDPQAEKGEAIFLQSSCVVCHAVRGTAANGSAAPDLTHLASRNMIAAETLPNTPANLAAWVTDPSQFKPGAQMPATEFDQDSLQALVAYLSSLK